jgi:hypothetical protein
MNGVVTIARLAWMRMWRGKLIWVTGILLVLPILAALAVVFGPDHHHADRWNDVAEMTFRSLVLLAPVLHLAPVLGEELDGKTYTYLWSRPLSRQAVVLGKLLAFTPAMAIAAAAVVAAAYMIIQPGEDNLLRVIGATVAGVVAASAFAVGIGSLLPRHPLVLALAYVMFAEQILPSVPAVNNVATLYHVGVIAGIDPSGDAGRSLVGLALLTGIWLGVAMWRASGLELEKGAA